MVKKKFLAALLAAAVMVTTVTDAVIPASEAQAAETAPQEIILDRTEVSNPILSSYPNGDVLYGGDPSVMVEGDTVYLYTGRDIPIDLSQVDSKGNKVQDGYYMFEWQCYTTKDLKNWKYEGVIMSADKESITWPIPVRTPGRGRLPLIMTLRLRKRFIIFTTAPGTVLLPESSPSAWQLPIRRSAGPTSRRKRITAQPRIFPTGIRKTFTMWIWDSR